MHELLRAHLFPDVYKQIEVRSQAKARKRVSERRHNLKAVIKQAVPSPVTLRFKRESEDTQSMPQAELRETKNRIQIDLPNPDALRTKKSNRELATAVLSIFEIALREKTDEKRRAKFTSLLLDLLKEW